MRIETAIDKLKKYHKCALELNKSDSKQKIFDPVAWALYQTWCDADKRRNDEENE